MAQGQPSTNNTIFFRRKQCGTVADVTDPVHLSDRLRGFGTTIFAQMSALATETGALNLGQGFPDSDGPSEVADAAVDAIRSGVNQYSPGPGEPDLRLAIAEHQSRFWKQTLDPATEVLVTAGATEAIAATLLGLCNPGDEVVVFDPTYDSYAASISMAGATIRAVTLRPDLQPNGDCVYDFDESELRSAFSDNTRLLILNTPHNPTGKVFSATELDLLAELCVKHDVLAMTDEVYEHLVFEGEHFQLAARPGMAQRTLTVSSGGKTFSFTGWKIGWVCGPASLVASVRIAKQFLTFVSGAPLQPAIAVGLRLDQSYFDSFVADMEAKRDLLCAALAGVGFMVHRPQGTYFATVDVTSVGYDDGITFCLELPKRAGVVAIPTQVFYQKAPTGSPQPGDTLVRFCFAKNDAMLIESGERLAAAFA